MKRVGRELTNQETQEEGKLNVARYCAKRRERREENVEYSTLLLGLRQLLKISSFDKQKFLSS